MFVVQGQSLVEFDWKTKVWAYFSEDKKEAHLKDLKHWYSNGTSTKLTKDVDEESEKSPNSGDSKTDLENKDNDKIKEYKRTYPLSDLSSGSVRKEFIFYTKYNLT